MSYGKPEKIFLIDSEKSQLLERGAVSTQIIGIIHLGPTALQRTDCLLLTYSEQFEMTSKIKIYLAVKKKDFDLNI